MKVPKQGFLYKVPNCSTYLYLRKIKYRGPEYMMACIELVKKHKWEVIHIVKNAKIYYKNIVDWERVDEK